jgi:carnitine monooxygenase subunit
MSRFPRPLVERVLDRFERGTNDPQQAYDTGPSSVTESADVFTDPDRFAREVHQFFRRTPQVVGWAGEVRGPNTFTAKDVAGVAVVITRDEHGTLRAFRNACTHRGAQVADGCGGARRLTCPYHAWSFDLGGQLVGQPEAWAFDDIDRATLGLRPLPVAEIAGLLVVGLEDDVDVDGALDGIEHELDWCGYADCDLLATETYHIAANWKLAVDVNLEVYHVASLHRESLHPIIVNHTVHDLFGRHGRHAFPLRSAADLIGTAPESWPEELPMSVVHTFFPSTAVLETPVSSQMFRIYPGRHPGECTVHLAEAALHEVHGDDERASRLFGFEYTKAVLSQEDFPVAEQCQRGAESGLDNFTFGRLEPMLAHWHGVWRQALDA